MSSGNEESNSQLNNALQMSNLEFEQHSRHSRDLFRHTVVSASSTEYRVLSNREIAQRARRAAERNQASAHANSSLNNHIITDLQIGVSSTRSAGDIGGSNLNGTGDRPADLHRGLSNRVIAQRARRARERNERESTENIRAEIHAVSDTGTTQQIHQTAEPVNVEASHRLQFTEQSHVANRPLSNRVVAQRARRARERIERESVQQNVTEYAALSARQIAQRTRRAVEINQRSNTENITPSTSNFDHQTSAANVLFLTREEILQREMDARRMGASTSRENEPDLHIQYGWADQRSNFEHLHIDPIEEISEESSDISEFENIANHQPDRHYLGMMNVECEFCNALHWMDERLQNSSISEPKFGSCCLQGKIHLPLLRRPPIMLESLYDGNDRLSKQFRKNIRAFNSTFAFTSLGVRLDDRHISGHGPRAFTIMGELRHRTGSLLPEDGHEPTYSQLYIYDPVQAFRFRHQRNMHLDPEVLQILQDIMIQHNQFASQFQYAYEILRSQGSNSNVSSSDVHAYLRYTSEQDRRRYNLPSEKEIAVILPGDGMESTASRDIILYLKSGHGLIRINECHPAYLPLHYVLFFPFGELGWSPDMTHVTSSARNRLTLAEYYCYRLFQRNSEYSAILRGHNLFQEFLCDAWAVTEQNRLRYITQNQSRIRSELYRGLVDIASSSVLTPHQVGQRIILPSSHTCSPRHLFEILQDSMAITRYNKHPDVFLTMTANPNWPEIKESLLPNQVANDRPDVIARVFELKRKALMDEINRNCIFGTKVAHVLTIEFQKRGLPHMHALFYLQHEDKIRSTDQVDRIITAEFPDPNTDTSLFETVITCMIHGPCGIRHPRAVCMENGRCTKKYPREFVSTTTMDTDGYPIYRRRDNQISYLKNGMLVDNRDIVPYNPYLTRKFNCHINAEVCAGIRCVKYIHKYIFKGHDRTTLVLDSLNEVQQYLDARYIGSPEAAWRLFENPMHEEIPSVVRLVVHLPGMHQVVFNPDDSINDILRRAASERTTLTAFFECCNTNEHARTLTYQEMPHFYRWKKPHWLRRQRGFAIGRMYFVPPNAGERFYLRLLLTVVRGPTSFDNLKSFNDTSYATFKESCIARGLLEDDQEWIQCLREASVMQTGYQLRRLFCVILSECHVTEPEKLWDEFALNICDDLPFVLRNTFHITNPTDDQIKDYGLYVLNDLLCEGGKCLSEFPHMPLPTRNWHGVIGNRLIIEHSRFDQHEQHHISLSNFQLLNTEQRYAHERILESVVNNYGHIFFLNGAAGTGKTFVYNTIAATCRSLQYIVLMVASSGIASLLLSNGRTAHSTFKIPLNILEDSLCGFKKQSEHADLFRQTKLLIWDEVTMQHKLSIEAVDRALRDTRNNENLFGGITVVFGGDFKQCLPVIPKGTREQIVSASLRRSYIWNYITILTLLQNMRLHLRDENNIRFDEALREIGNNPAEIIRLPAMINYVRSITELLSSTYPNLNNYSAITSVYLMERLILAARNDDVAMINSAALDIFPGNTYTYLAADKMADEDANMPANINRFPNEYLNTLEPAGLSPFTLKLKIGCPVILLRNLAPRDGLCNGTRLKVDCCSSRCIKATILTGDNIGKSVFIPRISLTPSAFDFPFKMTRRQFPIRLAYAITINKSQGQSVKHVGIDLRQEVFNHGQLYVALSRCTHVNNINILLTENADRMTKNIVYPEVLI